MPSRTGISHVVTTTRTYKGKTYRTHLLRRSYREDGRVKNETLGNLSHLPEPLIEIIRRSLHGETFVPLGQAFEVIGSLPHGHIAAVATAMQRLDVAALLSSKPSRERGLVLAMIAARIVAPSPALATARWWPSTTLAQDFGVVDATENDLHAAIGWLLARQDAIQKKLAARHPPEDPEGPPACPDPILLRRLAHYVEWHMREAWRELMLAGADPAHSFSTLMAELATIVRNTCRASAAGPEAPSFEVVTTPNATQCRALELVRQIRL
jgi:hypothetical protein